MTVDEFPGGPEKLAAPKIDNAECYNPRVKAYTVVLSPNPDSHWISVSCPAMPGAVSQGKTRAEALRNMQESMGGWYEVAREQGFQPLEETPELVGEWVKEILQDRVEEGWDLRVETTSLTPTIAVPVG